MRLRVLVAYSAFAHKPVTVQAYLDALRRFTDFDVSYQHVTHDTAVDISADDYDVLFHSYCARFVVPGHVSDRYKQWVRAFKGLKVLAVQDEYDHTNLVKDAIRDLGFNVLLTCVPLDQAEYVYPRSELPHLILKQVLTGYAFDEAELPAPKPLRERAVLIGYRGRALPARYGRLGFEKYEIGRRMREICERRRIPHDIAVDEASRIYGDDWFRFLGSCRSVLGSESGSNVFDFDGSLMEKFKSLELKKGEPLTYEEFAPHVEHLEGMIDMGQISPRVFEAAMTRTPLILFRGKYSDLIEPNTHYIALEKDFSNVDEVIARLADLAELERMSDRAFEDLVASRRYTYSAFAKFIERVVEKSYAKLAQSSPGEVAVRSELPAQNPQPGETFCLERPTREPEQLFDLWYAWEKSRSARNELRRLLPVLGELAEHATTWTAKLAETYGELCQMASPSALKRVGPVSLSNAKERVFASAMAGLEFAKSVEALLERDGKLRERWSRDLGILDDERRRDLELTKSVEEMVRYIDTLQLDFNTFYKLSVAQIEMLQAAMAPQSFRRRVARSISAKFKTPRWVPSLKQQG